MTNLYRPLPIGRAVALMCVLAYGGFARAAPRLACMLAGLLARSRVPNLPRQGLAIQDLSWVLARNPLRYGTMAYLVVFWPWISPWAFIHSYWWELWWAHQLNAHHMCVILLQLDWYWWSYGSFSCGTRRPGLSMVLSLVKLTPASPIGHRWVLVSALGNSSGS